MARRMRHLPHCQTRGCELEASTQRHLEELAGALIEAEGALAFQRERAHLAEYELAVLYRAHLRLLRALGSEAGDRRDVRLGLGLPA
jgi:hypothetical protein